MEEANGEMKEAVTWMRNKILIDNSLEGKAGNMGAKKCIHI